jgi:hypothetical protein
MNWNRIKKTVAGAGLLSGLLLGAGGVFGTTAMAQDRCYPRPYPNGGYYGGPYGGYRGGYGGYGGGYGGYGGGYGGYGGGYYGGYGGGSFSYWQQRGYRDGLDRGREDARSGRYPTPNNSEHFRNGNAAYRQGFARGYQIGFGQYGYYGRY